MKNQSETIMGCGDEGMAILNADEPAESPDVPKEDFVYLSEMIGRILQDTAALLPENKSARMLSSVAAVGEEKKAGRSENSTAATAGFLRDAFLLDANGYGAEAVLRKTLDHNLKDASTYLICLECGETETTHIRLFCADHPDRHNLLKCLGCGAEQEDEDTWYAEIQLFTKDQAEYLYGLACAIAKHADQIEKLHVD